MASKQQPNTLSANDLLPFFESRELHLNIDALKLFGGTAKLLKVLNCNLERGLLLDERQIEQRREEFGKNEFDEPESESWLSLFLECFTDSTVIVLMVAAFISLAVGLYENPSSGWIEGAAIFFAVFIVAVVTATNNYMKEAQFKDLNKAKEDVDIHVLRNTNKSHTKISITKLVVGDLVRLESGDKVPADAVLVDGSDVQCDESSVTGESDLIRKLPATSGGEDADAVLGPFLLSGSTLSTGTCHAIVCAVGERSSWGKIKKGLEVEKADTPLQEKLSGLADQIGYFGMAAAGLTFGAMMLVWYLQPENRAPGASLLDHVVNAFIMAVTIVVVAVPEGLPLAVTLSLAFSTKKMMDDKNLIRHLSACETMGNATNICSDKTGTLTQNKMSVVQVWIGGNHFPRGLTPGDMSKLALNTISVGIAANTTATITIDEKTKKQEILGNKTEGALLLILQHDLQADYDSIRKREIALNQGPHL